MPSKELPVRPNLEQYRKQAKELVQQCRLQNPEALSRLRQYHPDYGAGPIQAHHRITLTDAQLVLAREHGYPSWPKFAAHIESVRIAHAVTSLSDPAAAFLIAATVPRVGSHKTDNVQEAEAILAAYPEVQHANIYTAAVLGDATALRAYVDRQRSSASAPGGPHGWDPLTYLCFSRYLALDPKRSDGFVFAARILLESGANANTGWYETIDTPPRQVPERVIYGAAGIAQHAELTRLLLEYGADPNDEETPYHVPEGYDNTVLRILLESDRLNERSRTWILTRKADWHDADGMRLALEHGANPNLVPRWGRSALQHAIQRDNSLETIQLLLDYGADPHLPNAVDGRSGVVMAARRGRGDILRFFQSRSIDLQLEGVDKLIAACAMADPAPIDMLVREAPQLAAELKAEGSSLLAEFAGTGNTEGLRCLLDLGIPVDALYAGDGYFDIAAGSTALHVAAWRAWPTAVKILIERGAPVNARDEKGRTPLQLAVRACVDSYWMSRRTPESVEALVNAGASAQGIPFPCGYEEVDALLARAKSNPSPRQQ